MLIVGYGDIGQRVARLLGARVRVLAVSRTPAGPAGRPRPAGGQMLQADLDQPATLHRLAGLATHLLHLAPPPPQGLDDPRTRALLQALARRQPPQALVYASTTGVYGDCGGALVDETRPPRPANARAQRRVQAENLVRRWGRRQGVRASVLRIPGIYAATRPGGGPRQRLLRATPALLPQDDVYTNHIHADDLARACCLALWRASPQRLYHVCDNSQLKMGDYFDLAARLLGLPPLPRISRTQAQTQLPPALLSFMNESRRLRNRRLLAELGLRLHHPTPESGLLASN